MQGSARDDVLEPMDQLTQALTSARLALEHLLAAGIDATEPAAETCASAVSLLEHAIATQTG